MPKYLWLLEIPSRVVFCQSINSIKSRGATPGILSVSYKVRSQMVWPSLLEVKHKARKGLAASPSMTPCPWSPPLSLLIYYLKSPPAWCPSELSTRFNPIYFVNKLSWKNCIVLKISPTIYDLMTSNCTALLVILSFDKLAELLLCLSHITDWLTKENINRNYCPWT